MKLLVILSLVLLTSCRVSTLPQAGIPPYQPPILTNAQITSGIVRTPYSPEELATPFIQAAIENCENFSVENCRSKTAVVDNRTQFTRGETVHVYIEYTRVFPGHVYYLIAQLIDPQGKKLEPIVLTFKLPLETPQGLVHSVFFQFDTEVLNELGKWTVELNLDDHIKKILTYTLVGDGV